jgi:glucosylceramidase
VPPVEPEAAPSLIVSSEGNLWVEGEVTPVETGAATFTVDTGTEYQRWLGFGGTFNEAGWAALQNVSEEERARAIRLLFSKSEGAAFTWGRIPIGSSDYGNDRYSLNDTPEDLAMENFSIERDESTLIPYILAARDVKADIKFWASPWSPPGWMKFEVTTADATSDSPNPPDTSLPQHSMDTGWMRGEPEVLEAYALYFVKFVQSYAEHGIIMDHVQPQNEPGWQQMYPTCGWGHSNFYGQNGSVYIANTSSPSLAGFVADYLKPALLNAGLDTKVWFGTLSNDRTFPSYMQGVTPDLVEGVALQWETIVRVEEMKNQGFIVMQSEHRCGNYPWGSTEGYVTHQTNQSPTDTAPNDFAYGQETWDLMVDWISRGVNIYSAWNMILDTHGTNLDNVRVWNQNALLIVDRDAGELIATPAYYVFRHLAQYVEPEAVRVAIDGNALAFKNPNGSVVAIMRTSSAGAQTVSIDGTLLQFEASGNGWVTVNWPG